MFKIQEIREIIRLIDQSSISKFKYENDGAKLSIKKQVVENNQVHNIVQEVQAQVTEQEAVQTPAAPKQEPVGTKEAPKQQADAEPVVENNDDSLIDIVSPMVGTFYRKPSPDSDAYVEIGDNVEENTVVCIVEAMKLFNEIEAEATGEIVEVLVQDGELVEYGQPLFKIKAK